MKKSGQTYAGGESAPVKHDRQAQPGERRASVRNYGDEILPQIVEDRLQEVYGQIRRGEVRQMNRRGKADEGTEGFI